MGKVLLIEELLADTGDTARVSLLDRIASLLPSDSVTDQELMLSHVEKILDSLVDSISGHTSRLNLRRYDVNNGSLQASFHMDCNDVDSLVKLEHDVRKLHPSASLSFVERSSIQGV